METKSAMSKPMAAFALMEMMRGDVTTLQAEALQIAVRNLVKRYSDQMKNKARRREAGFHTPQSIVEGGGECHDPECGSGAVFCNPPMIKEVK